jgi:hypothetical protein
VRRWLRLTALAGAVIAVCAAGTPAALAAKAVGNPILQDCNAHGVLTHNYSLKDLQHALAIMPASYKEYGNCQDAITAAITKVKRGNLIVPKSDSGGSFLPTPVIVILVLLILAALTFGALALRRRRGNPGGGPDDGEPPAGAAPPPAAE